MDWVGMRGLRGDDRLEVDRCPIEATAPAAEQQRSTVPVWLQGVVLLVHLLPLGLAAGTLVEDAEVVHSDTHSLPLVLLALTALLGLTAGIHQLILRPLCQEAEAMEQAQSIGQSRGRQSRACAGVTPRALFTPRQGVKNVPYSP